MLAKRIVHIPIFIFVFSTLFGVLFFVMAQDYAQAQETIVTCTLRTDITVKEYEKITEETPGTAFPAGTTLNLFADIHNRLLCIYSFTKWLSEGLVVVVGALAILMILWAALLFITARDNPEQMKRARLVAIFAVVGALIAGAAWAAPIIVLSAL